MTEPFTNETKAILVEYQRELKRMAERLDEFSDSVRPVLPGQSAALKRTADDLRGVEKAFNEHTLRANRGLGYPLDQNRIDEQPVAKKYPAMTVQRIDNQGDRLLLYEYANELPHEYHIIAKADSGVKVGDTIKYESGGFNFGWHIQEETDRGL